MAQWIKVLATRPDDISKLDQWISHSGKSETTP